MHANNRYDLHTHKHIPDIPYFCAAYSIFILYYIILMAVDGDLFRLCARKRNVSFIKYLYYNNYNNSI